MAETLSTTFNDSGTNGRIILYENPFKSEKHQFFGRFERNTVNTKTLIARIQKHKAGTNELAVQEIAGFLKEEILQAIKNGEAVNLMDLGTLYIVPNKKFNGTEMEAGSEQNLTVKFSCSPLLRNAVSDIRIKEIKMAPKIRQIIGIKDLYTEAEDGTVSVGRMIRIKGSKLKIVENKAQAVRSGLFVCPVDDNGNAITEESAVKQCKNIVKNSERVLEFYVPDDIEKGKCYKFLIRTYYCTNDWTSKGIKEIWSDEVMAV